MPFRSLGLHPSLARAAADLGYADPTPVQAGAIPPGLLGRDVLATAQTGTGKTAAFLLPILHRLLSLPRGTPRALIVSPTRELAEQIVAACRGLARQTPLTSALLVGGRPAGPQQRAMLAGPDVVVGTPGRLLDHMRQAPALFARVATLVLDEADAMLDMGFLPDVRRIVTLLPGRRQTLLFSATMPPAIAAMAADLLRNPAAVRIGRRDATASGVTQAAYPVPAHLKSALLRQLLRRADLRSVLVFVRTKHGAKKLARFVAAEGHTVAELHGNRSPSQRAAAMDGFRRGAARVMVATNVAARGLDVRGVSHVISTDVPDVPEDYVHRVGRTGRAGEAGDAIVLVSPEEEGSLARIERQVGKQLPRVRLPDFDYGQPRPQATAPASTGRGPAKDRRARAGGRR